MTQSPLNSHFNRIAGQCQAHAHMRTLTQCLNIGHSDIQALWRSPLESAKVGKRGAVSGYDFNLSFALLAIGHLCELE